MLNRVSLVGRISREPESRATSTGANIAEFHIAVSKRFKPRDNESPDADFFRVKCFGQSAEFVIDYAEKGRLASIDGRLETRKYTDKLGQSREIVEVVADSVQLLDRPRESKSAQPETVAPATSAAPPANARRRRPEQAEDPFAA